MPLADSAAHASRKRTPAIPQSRWRRHQARIIDLYITQGKSLEKVIRVLRRKGFAATDKQYKRQFARWNVQKNRRGVPSDLDDSESASEDQDELIRGDWLMERMPVACVDCAKAKAKCDRKVRLSQDRPLLAQEVR